MKINISEMELPDNQILSKIGNELARMFNTIGLKPLNGEASSDPIRAVSIAEWADGRPIISAWHSNWFIDQPDEFVLWVGFEGDKSQCVKLRNSILAKNLYEAKEFVRFRANEWNSRIVPDAPDTIMCEYDSHAYYVGFYETSLKATSITHLCQTYFDLIENVVENVESPIAADVNDLQKQKKNGDIDDTEFEQLIQARRGQGRFRKNLEDIWNNRCAASQCGIHQSLRASHIRPWRISDNNQRLDPENGLLLNAFADSLFDKGLISFDDEGKIIISKDIPRHEIEFFRLEGMGLSKKPSLRQQDYLRYHREELGKNLAGRRERS